MTQIDNGLYQHIRQLIVQARTRMKVAVNVSMVDLYWSIGQRIVEEEQAGESRAAYGKALLKQLSEQLTKEFGTGFNERNLRYFRGFYQAFPIRNALRSELSWTQYRILCKVNNEKARTWYMDEAANNAWSSRALERQIEVEEGFGFFMLSFFMLIIRIILKITEKVVVFEMYRRLSLWLENYALCHCERNEAIC